MRSNIDSEDSLCFVLFPLCSAKSGSHHENYILCAQRVRVVSQKLENCFWEDPGDSWRDVVELVAWESPFFGRLGLGVCSHLCPSETLSLLGISWKLWERWRLWGLGNIGEPWKWETCWNHLKPKSSQIRALVVRGCHASKSRCQLCLKQQKSLIKWRWVKTGYPRIGLVEYSLPPNIEYPS